MSISIDAQERVQKANQYDLDVLSTRSYQHKHNVSQSVLFLLLQGCSLTGRRI